MFSIFKRNLSSCLTEACQNISEISLHGRDYVSPKSLTVAELKSVLWTALDLKHVSKQKCNQIPDVKNTKVSLLLDKSSAKTQLPMNLASHFLQTPLNTIVNNKWKHEYVFVWDYGRLLASSSDIIFCQVEEQKTVEEIADGANVPVVNISSSEYNLIKTLADLMTVYEHFSRLKCLTVAWIGKPEALFNTYLKILPQLKMNIRYCLVDGSSGDQCTLEEAHKFSQKYNTEIHELWSPAEACHRADIISTSAHDNSDFQICISDMKEAAINWIFLHQLPRGECDVQKEVFIHKNSSVWKSVENLEWIYAALIIRFTSASYNHTTREPSFDADEITANSSKINKCK